MSGARADAVKRRDFTPDEALAEVERLRLLHNARMKRYKARVKAGSVGKPKKKGAGK